MTTSTIDVTDMLGVHAAFRNEFGQLPRRIRGIRPQDVEHATVVAEHFDLLTAFLHAHHTGEDESLWPVLEQRTPMRAELIESVAHQHDQLDELTQHATGYCRVWRESARVNDSIDFERSVEELTEFMRQHLDQEEDRILPLARVHLSSAEWFALGDHARNTLDEGQMTVVLGMISEAMPEAGMYVLNDMPQEARAGWLQFGRPAYAEYRNRLDDAIS